MRLIILIAIALLIAAPATALEILRGTPIQGGLVLLQTDKGATLTANGTPLMVTDDGIAAIGFARDDSDAVVLESRTQDGEVQRLTLTPEARIYEEQRIDGLPDNMVTPPDEVIARIRRDSAAVKKARGFATPLDAFAGEMAWPTRGIITGIYGSRRILNGEPRAPHYGIDIAAPKGTEVKAPQAGIIRMTDDLYFTGWTVIMDHGHGLSSTFLHLDSVSVAVGERVEKGAVIGTVGSSGRSTGPHLDWRINLFDKRLDPMLIAGEMP